MSGTPPSLRERAEQLLAESDRSARSERSDLQRVVHELRVYQVELELQNEELLTLKDAAEAANRAKSDFVANVSHEVRTSLNIILGLAQVLTRTASPEQAHYIAHMNLAGRHLLSVLDDILDLAKIEAGRMSLSDVDFAPGEVLETVRDMVAEAAAAKGLRLTVETAGLPERLRGDPVRLRQALLNYASNAVKFTERGSVILRAERMRQEAVGEWLRFEVRDTGIGMDAATQARLFRPFEQGDAPVSRRYSGTGLGLDLVRRIAGLMGGGVGLESAPGRGSLFWFTARLGKAGAATVPAPAPGRVDAARTLAQEHAGARVLLADDDRMSRYASALLLRELGLEVELADHGEQALASCLAAPPDIVLVDLRMPLMDGIEFTRRIRAGSVGREVPIVALTGDVFDADRASCFAAGMDDFIAKPFTLEQVAEVLLRQLRKRQGRSAQGSSE